MSSRQYGGQGANGGITMTPFGGGYGNANGGAYSPYKSNYGVPGSPSPYSLQRGGQSAAGGWGSGVIQQQALNGQYEQFRQGKDEDALFSQGINERNMALSHKYDMEMLNAKLAGDQSSMFQQMLALGINMPTNSQVDTARGRYDSSKANYEGLSQNGMYSDDQEGMLEANAGQQVDASTRAMQQNMNDLASSQGMGANPNAVYYAGNAGQYAAAGARGDVRADITRQEAMAKERGYAGEMGVAGSLAGLDVTPTKENAFMGIYGPGGMGGGYGTGPDPNIPYGGDAVKPKKNRY